MRHQARLSGVFTAEILLARVTSEQGMGAQALRHFIGRARRAAIRSAILTAIADAVLASCALTVVAAGVAAWSLRGDLADLGLRLGVFAVTAAAVGFAAYRLRARAGNPLQTARTIARTRAPLSRDPAAKRLKAELLLRHEVLGAYELLEEAPTERSLRSEQLVGSYVEDVARRAGAVAIDPSLALPGTRWRIRAALAVVLAFGLGTVAWWPPLSGGLMLMLSATDGRPPTPPEPVWSTLTLQLEYPEHTSRPDRVVPNPSGALRVPAGTRVGVELTGRKPASASRIVVSYDPTELTDAPEAVIVELESSDAAGLDWVGSFVVAGAGSWTIVMLDDVDDELAEATRRSAALPVELEPDRPPEVELVPLPRSRREVHEHDRVDVRFHARDDFGLASAELVYQLPDGQSHRLPAQSPNRAVRTWRQRYTWDISQIPISERSEILYWVEVRDNDPGLGLDPLPDPPGKVTRSASMRLLVKDDEAEHANNIVKLTEIRDAAVDLLAVRMTTRAFNKELSRPPDPMRGELALPPVPVRAQEARDILRRGGELLAALAAAVDSLSVDTLAHERDVATLAEIHGRLMKLHRAELKKHEDLPPGSERIKPDAASSALRALAPHNAKEIAQLEDEIIRIDDLVDGQIIERLEALVARLEATQRKLVELLEQLKAGDDSVRPLIDQLEQRRREDLRRIAEARAMLRKEVDEEFMNLDAFAVLEAMKQSEQISEMLRRGEVDEALERARGELGDVRQLRDEVQQRAGAVAPEGAQLSEEERRRMQLLRELSRLQDEEGNLRAQTRSLHEEWREKVKGEAASDKEKKNAANAAEKMRRKLDEINDARLGREGRRGLEDAKDALEQLKSAAERKNAGQLELSEIARRAAEALQRAQAGSEQKEQEGKALKRAAGEASGLQRSLSESLPPPSEVLSQEQRQQMGELKRRQQGLRRRAGELSKSELGDELPVPGKKAMRRADRGMNDSAKSLEQPAPRDALDGQNSAWRGLQDAIDSLRRGSPPPPASSSRGDASTEAERDRSLRDALMDAMREGAPDGYREPVQRYYEELLR